MKIGLYKPGQGYWVRVMTAAMIAIITFATAGWLMGQMAVLADKLPVHNWVADVGGVSGGQVQPGQRVKLLTQATSTTPAEEVGTASITAFESGSQTVHLGEFAPAREGRDPVMAMSLAPASEGSGFAAPLKSNPRKVPVIRPAYLQGIAAALALLTGALLAFYFVGMNPSSVEFLISTDMELKKVNWSTKKDIKNSTLVVVGASFLLAAVLFIIDQAFSQAFILIGLLERQ